MNPLSDALSIITTVVWLFNVLFEVGIVAAALYRFRTSPAGLLVAGSYSVIIVVSIFARMVRWLAPSLASPVEPSGLALMTATSLANGVLLVLLGAGILMIPSSIDALANKASVKSQ